MNVHASACIERMLAECDRIVFTAGAPFNPQNKRINNVLADIRDAASIELAQDALLIDPVAGEVNWMSPVDVYIAFLNGKRVIGSVGVVLMSWLRSEDWEGDLAVSDHLALRSWLRNHGVSG